LALEPRRTLRSQSPKVRKVVVRKPVVRKPVVRKPVVRRRSVLDHSRPAFKTVPSLRQAPLNLGGASGCRPGGMAALAACTPALRLRCIDPAQSATEVFSVTFGEHPVLE
jgi:hypothetical protein